jgi:uncharacterized protein with PQ loop repeat
MGKFEGLVGIAGILGLISFSTLIQKIYETKNTSSLPWTWVTMNIAAQSLSFIYAVANGAYGIYIPNSIFLAGLAYIFYTKFNNEKNEKVEPKKL